MMRWNSGSLRAWNFHIFTEDLLKMSSVCDCPSRVGTSPCQDRWKALLRQDGRARGRRSRGFYQFRSHWLPGAHVDIGARRACAMQHARQPHRAPGKSGHKSTFRKAPAFQSRALASSWKSSARRSREDRNDKRQNPIFWIKIQACIK